MRALLIEDETSDNSINRCLFSLQYKIDITYDMQDALYYLNIRKYNIIIYNSSQSSSNFLTQSKKIKKENKDVFVILISSSSNPQVEIIAYQHLVDYYISNPVNLAILTAKIKSLQYDSDSDIVEKGKIKLNSKNGTITYKNRHNIKLNGKSFLILEYLLKNSDTISSKEVLLNNFWVEPELVTPNVIEVAINNIRKEFKNYTNDQIIETIRKKGYKIILI